MADQCLIAIDKYGSSVSVWEQIKYLLLGSVLLTIFFFILFWLVIVIYISFRGHSETGVLNF